MMAADEFEDFLLRNWSEDDVVDILEKLEGIINQSTVVEIQQCGVLQNMIVLFLKYLWESDPATVWFVLQYLENDYNFIAYRIRQEYQLSHSAVSGKHQLTGVQLVLVSRPDDPLRCHPTPRLSVPSNHHEQWDHTLTFAITGTPTHKFHYSILSECLRVCDETGEILRVAPLGDTLRYAEKCRTQEQHGAALQISLWIRLKGLASRSKHEVKFSLQATLANSTSISCASVIVDFLVKRKKTGKNFVLSHDLARHSSDASRDSSSMASDDQEPRDDHMTTWFDGKETSQSGVALSHQPAAHQAVQLYHGMPKLEAFIYEKDFGERCFQLMFKRLVECMNKPQDFHISSYNWRKYFGGCLEYSDMAIVVRILESTQAYSAGDVDKSYARSLQSKALLAKAQNYAVGLAETNIQLVGVYRRRKEFGLAVKMIEEAQQALLQTKLCQTHAMVHKTEAVLYSVMLQQSTHPNPALRTLAISKFKQALSILREARCFHASPEHHIKECYLQLAEVYVDVPSSDLRSGRQVSDDDIIEAEKCLNHVRVMMKAKADFYGRGNSKLRLVTAKLQIRKENLLVAERLLKYEMKALAEAGKSSSMDYKFCDELLSSVITSPEYALQKLRQRAGKDEKKEVKKNKEETKKYKIEEEKLKEQDLK